MPNSIFLWKNILLHALRKADMAVFGHFREKTGFLTSFSCGSFGGPSYHLNWQDSDPISCFHFLLWYLASCIHFILVYGLLFSQKLQSEHMQKTFFWWFWPPQPPTLPKSIVSWAKQQCPVIPWYHPWCPLYTWPLIVTLWAMIAIYLWPKMAKNCWKTWFWHFLPP
jgi:hypothetical protein